MAKRFRFVKNRRASDQLQDQTQYQLALAASARAVAAAANVAVRGTPPAGAIMPRAGRKTSPIVVQHTGSDVLVVNTDYGAVITEFGSRHTPPGAPLRRGTQAAGLKLSDHGQ